MESVPEDSNKDTFYIQKINIFGDSGVGKTSLITCMEHFSDENFVIKEDLRKSSNNDSFKDNSSIVEQIKRVKFKINEDKKEDYYNIYETSIYRYNEIKINLDILLEQTECVIIMWNNSDTDTFENIKNLVLTIKSVKENNYNDIPIFLVQNKIDLELNESRSSKTNRSVKDINETINEIKKEYPNLIHKKTSLLNKDDCQELIFEIYRKLENQVQKKNKEDYELVRFKYPFKQKENFSRNLYKKNQITIVLLGDSNTGKTSFLHYLFRLPIDKVISTIAISERLILAEVCDEKALINIMDTAGQERYNSLSNIPSKKAHGFLLFFDVTNKNTFDSLDYYIERIKLYNESNEIILIGNKIDDLENRKVQKEKAKEYAENQQIKYYECSSKDGINIIEVLNEITFKSYKRYKETNKNNDISISIKKKENQQTKFCYC